MFQSLQELYFPDGCDGKPLLLILHSDLLEGYLLLGLEIDCQEDLSVCSLANYLLLFIAAEKL